MSSFVCVPSLAPPFFLWGRVRVATGSQESYSNTFISSPMPYAWTFGSAPFRLMWPKTPKIDMGIGRDLILGDGALLYIAM